MMVLIETYLISQISDKSESLGNQGDFSKSRCREAKIAGFV